MTYTFKLAKRLAVSRNFSMLPVLLLFAACGDATAPEGSPSDSPTAGSEWRPRDITAVAVRVSPSDVTLETNQLIHFRAHGRTSAGDSVGALITWSTTGGTILPDGRFSAAAIGTYQIIGRNRVRDRIYEDTSTVVVVRRQPRLASIEVTPGSASLTPGTSQTFTAIGRHSNGSPVPIGVNWTSTGGVIDDGGTYVAGDTAGTYQVIATNTAGTLADTAAISISAPPSPPPPVPAPPPPTLEKLVLSPPSVTLAASATKQFGVYGLTPGGDSVAVSVDFTATGGVVTPEGLFTAGPTAGTFHLIAVAGSLADTSAITITPTLGSGTLSGIPFGAFHVPLDSLGLPSVSYNSTYMNGVVATIKSDLERVKARNGRVMLGLLRRKTKDANGHLSVAATRAELERWKAAVDLTPYLNDGTITAIYVSDDITGAHLWGGEVPPLARVDSLALVVKTLWPTAIPVVRAKPTQLTSRSWRWMEAAWAQYNGPFRDGPPQTYRAAQVAAAKALKLGLVLWMNVLDGGCGTTGACLPGVPGTSIPGTYKNAIQVKRFQMSAAEVHHYGSVFLAEPYSCGAIHWQWSPLWNAEGRPAEQVAMIQAFDKRADVRQAMAALLPLATQRDRTSCLQR